MIRISSTGCPTVFRLLIHNYQAKLFAMTPADDLTDLAHLGVIDVEFFRYATEVYERCRRS